MVVVVAVLTVLIAVLFAIVVVQELRTREVKKEAAIRVDNANKTAQMLLALLNKEHGTPPERLIEAVGTTVNKILAGQPIQVTEQTQDVTEEEAPYYPDVEFDEWLGSEGMPTAAGWWSPPKNAEPNENEN